jgi:hypothetical protein
MERYRKIDFRHSHEKNYLIKPQSYATYLIYILIHCYFQQRDKLHKTVVLLNSFSHEKTQQHDTIKILYSHILYRINK